MNLKTTRPASIRQVRPVGRWVFPSILSKNAPKGAVFLHLHCLASGRLVLFSPETPQQSTYQQPSANVCTIVTVSASDHKSRRARYPSFIIGLISSSRVLRLGVQIRRSLPSRPFQQSNSIPNRHGKVRSCVLGEDRESDSDHSSRWPKDRRTRPALSGARVIHNAPGFEIRNVALRRQRRNQLFLCQIFQLRLDRTISLLNW